MHVTKPEPSWTVTDAKKVFSELLDSSLEQNMFDNDLLLSLPDSVWLLQLVGMQDHGAIMQYVKTHALKDQAWLYQTPKFADN